LPVVIPYAWNLILDTETPLFYNLTILGEVYFDVSRVETILRAKIIWVRSGKLIAGSPDSPFPGKITIELVGEETDPTLVIDSFLMPTSKVLAVTNVIL